MAKCSKRPLSPQSDTVYASSAYLILPKFSSPLKTCHLQKVCSDSYPENFLSLHRLLPLNVGHKALMASYDSKIGKE